jgi:hypothetical protein
MTLDERLGFGEMAGEKPFRIRGFDPPPAL